LVLTFVGNTTNSTGLERNITLFNATVQLNATASALANRINADNNTCGPTYLALLADLQANATFNLETCSNFAENITLIAEANATALVNYYSTYIGEVLNASRQCYITACGEDSYNQLGERCVDGVSRVQFCTFGFFTCWGYALNAQGVALVNCLSNVSITKQKTIKLLLPFSLYLGESKCNSSCQLIASSTSFSFTHHPRKSNASN
jgi:hypothetical protein